MKSDAINSSKASLNLNTQVFYPAVHEGWLGGDTQHAGRLPKVWEGQLYEVHAA